MTHFKNPMVYERLYVQIPLYAYVLCFEYMFYVSIREYSAILDVFYCMYT